MLGPQPWQSRLAERWLWALAVSALMHVLLWQVWVPAGGARVARPKLGAVFQVQIDTKPESRLLTLSEVIAPATLSAAPGGISVNPQASAATTQPQSSVTAPAAEVAAPVASSADTLGPDLRLYGARELDRYPRPATALQLPAWGVGPTSLRFWVSINQVGVVESVTAIDLAAGDLSQQAEALIRQTRFMPAERAGHAVRSRVQVVLRVVPD